MEFVKNLRKNTIVLLLITFIVLFFVLKDDFNDIIDTLFKMKYGFIALAVLFFFIFLFIKAFISYKTVKEKEKYSLLEALKHTVIVQFFNGITPFSTGGQPMEIYMLTKHDISGSRATSIVVQNFIFYQTALVIFGIFAVVMNYFCEFFPKVPLLRELVLLGFIINTLVLLGILLIAFSSRFTGFCLKMVLKITKKIKVFKDNKKTKEKWENRIKEFNSCAKELKNRKLFFVSSVLLNIISLAFFYAIPYIIVRGTPNLENITLIESLVASAYVLIIGSFVPIPGASGGIEYGFLAFFGNFIPGKITPAILLVWRFITYYLPMIIGGILFSFDRGESK